MADPLTDAEVREIETRAHSPQTMGFSFTHYQQDVATLLTAYRQLQAERDTFKEGAAHKEMDAFNLSQRLETVQQQRDQLRAALRKYGHHLRTPDGKVQCDNGCQCGLTHAAQEAVARQREACRRLAKLEAVVEAAKRVCLNPVLRDENHKRLALALDSLLEEQTP